MIRTFWSIVFFLVPILAIAAFLMAAAGVWPFAGAWLPVSFSDSGDTIDHLFNLIHWISAAILLITGLAIGWVVWRFEARQSPSARHFHHNTRLEIAWTIVPAAILIFLAIYQMNSWAENKMNRPTITSASETIPKPPLLLVKAKQFGWEFHYAGPDGIVQTQDDIYIENEMCVPVGEDIVLQLESDDVIHSLFVPELRLKQDIVPGMTQFAWFRANQTGEMEIICAELCGWGHFKMKAILKIVPRDEFDQWLTALSDEMKPEFAAPDSQQDKRED